MNNNLNELPEILDVSHIQRYLGVGRVQAYQLCDGKSFHVVKVGRRIKIARQVFENWLKGGQV
jgi:hypothetical protein